jgi:hypothetical protein
MGKEFCPKNGQKVPFLRSKKHLVFQRFCNKKSKREFMPLISERIGIISERMGITSEEIRIVGEEMHQSSERIYIIGEEIAINGETISEMNNAELRGPAWNLKVDENRWRRSVVVFGGELRKALLDCSSDIT